MSRSFNIFLYLGDMIDVGILEAYGATTKTYKKEETLFYKHDTPRFYFQIVSGKIKMNTYNDAGKEFIQGIFSEGESFGEPPLFGSFDYPANAVALEDSEVLVLRKERFHELLINNPEIHLKFTGVLANRLFYKSTMASGNSNESSSERILTIIDYLKTVVHKKEVNERFELDLTRQQLADLTGLRVETVIRSLKRMEENGEIVIENRKVYR